MSNSFQLSLMLYFTNYMTKVLTTNISMQEKLITLKDLAAFFSLSEGSIYKLVDCRKINFYKIG